MAGGIIYNGKSVVPAPFISLQKVYDETQDKTQVGSSWVISVEGKFLPNMGSPTSSGTLWAYPTTYGAETVTSDNFLTIALRKQEAIRSLFASGGKLFTILGYDGGQPLTCNPRVKSFEFPKGSPTSWAQLSDYKVNLEADVVYINGTALSEDSGDLATYKVETAENNWNIEPLDENLQTFRLTHQVSAKGKRFYSSSGTLDYLPWENARNYVLNKTGLGIKLERAWATGVLNAGGLSGYNYVRSQQISELGGTFSVNETWLAYNVNGSTPATDEYNVDVRIGMAGEVQVGVKGEIKGLEVRDGATRQLYTTKYQNAVQKMNSVSTGMYARASGISATILHPTPLNRTFGHNNITGTITYNYEYDNRPGTVISGALSESISYNFDYPADVFAELCVLGRAAGPLLQSIQTITSNKKSITYEAIFPATTQITNFTRPDTNSFISGLAPTATQVFKNKDAENMNPTTGKYSRQVSWTYQ